jgi:hypothetical protein
MNKETTPQEQSILSIENAAKQYTNDLSWGTKEHYDAFIAGANEMLPIIKELLETLIKANLYVPPKFYGQGESVDNDHYLEIQTTLDKYKNYL